MFVLLSHKKVWITKSSVCRLTSAYAKVGSTYFSACYIQGILLESVSIVTGMTAQTRGSANHICIIYVVIQNASSVPYSMYCYIRYIGRPLSCGHWDISRNMPCLNCFGSWIVYTVGGPSTTSYLYVPLYISLAVDLQHFSCSCVSVYTIK